MQTPFTVGGVDLVVTPSIGIAGFPDAGDNASALLQHADIAMYRAKSRGRNTIEFFTEEMNTVVRESFELELALRRALAQNEFELYYQPIIDRVTGGVSTVEALLRWHREGAVEPTGPDEFLPMLERTGLIREVGDWVLQTACAQCRVWQCSLDPSLRISVNVSPAQLAMQGFAERVAQVLRDTDLAPARLVIEITEQVLLERSDENIATLNDLREIGVGVAIDDFGSGYSSLSYLTVFPFDTVKIDRSFVQQVANRSDNALITAGILAIANGLGRNVIAEGVETEDQLCFLAEHDCPEVQGFLFSRPLTAAGFEEFCTCPASPGNDRRCAARW